jgi:hypothetical protein
MSIIIGSEGMGSWGKHIIDFLIKKINQNTIIEYKNSSECNFVIKSLFTMIEEEWNTEPKKYLYWSGEYYFPFKNPLETKNIYIITTLDVSTNNLYVPYFLYSPHLYKDRFMQNINRKHLIAYCSSRYIKERENMYDKFVENTPMGSCHALGNCCGNHPETKTDKVDGDWKDNSLIKSYTNYKFVLAIENTKHWGYITEKIINAFYSGAIPIYWGCSTINNFFNKKSFINVSDFESVEKCIEYVLSMDDAAISQMTSEPFYNRDNDVVNLLDDEYNMIHTNRTLDKYIDQFKQFLAE